MERSYGSFQRTLCFPEDADQDNIRPICKNGIMNITIPGRAVTRPEAKKIDITTG